MMKNRAGDPNQDGEIRGKECKMEKNGLLWRTGAPHFSRIVRFFHALQSSERRVFRPGFSAWKGPGRGMQGEDEGTTEAARGERSD